MKKKLHTLIAATVLTFLPFTLHAQTAGGVKVDYEKKVIYADSLTLPKSINVGALLRILPELLLRPGEYTLDNYEVQIDGVPVGEAADAVLSVLQLGDIERLEMVNSPSASDLNGGMSGAVIIHLRPIAEKRKGVSGKIAAGISTERSAMADFLIDYRSDKWTVRGMAFGENTANTKTINMFSSNEVWDEKQKQDYWSQLTRAMVTYQPNERNSFELTMTGGFNYGDMLFYKVKGTPPVTYNEQTVNVRQPYLNARFRYTTKFSELLNLRFTTQYGYKPSHIWGYDSIKQPNSDERIVQNVFESAAELFGTWKMSGGKVKCGYNVAARGAATSDNKMVQPLAQLTVEYGKLRVRAGAEYQWYKGSIDSIRFNDWTGRLVTEWQFNPQQRIRLIMQRQISLPIISQEIGADYLASKSWGGQTLSINPGFSFCHSDGTPGISNYINANLMTLYQYNIFFVSFTGNFYMWKQDSSDSGSKYKTYYNLSLMPSLNLPSGWRTAMNLRYYSRVTTLDDDFGDCLSFQVNVGKTWGNLNVYAYGRAPLTGRTRNIIKEENITYLEPLVPASLGCGASWKF